MNLSAPGRLGQRMVSVPPMLAARYHLDSGEVEWLPERTVVPEVKSHASTKKPPVALPPHTALAMLQAGHRRYVTGSGGHPDLSRARRETLSAGQSPLAIVVTCSDSRVAPEHVFDAGLGELFVVRIAGNVLNDSVQASVEYAIEHLGASLVVWMGHETCGAVKAAVSSGEHAKLSESMRALLEKIEPAVERAKRTVGPDELVAAAVEQNVLRAITELRKSSSVVREFEATGKLGVLPVIYRLESGDLKWLDEATERTAAKALQPAPAPAGETSAHGRSAPQPQSADEHSAGAFVHDKHVSSVPSEPGHGDPQAAGHTIAIPEHPAAGHHADAAGSDPHTATVTSASSQNSQKMLYGTLGISLLAATLGVVVTWSLQRRKKPGEHSTAA